MRLAVPENKLESGTSTHQTHQYLGGSGDDNTAIYNFDTSLADQGLYKLWRDGSGGYFTVSLENYGGHHPQYFLQFLCIKNDTEKDPSDQC